MRTLLCLLFCLSAGLGQAAPAVLLAELYRSEIDPAEYLVSEKLDGVRAIWDGKTLSYRSGHQIHAPDWFVQALPATPLDGELWAGRGSFERLSGTVRKSVPLDVEWREVRYMIFELPDAPGDFNQRALRIREIVAAAKLPWLQAVVQFQVKDRAELEQHMQRVLKAGGEGLMLHLATAPYLTGRSDALLKLKPWLDAEARVIAHIPGKGKYRGLLGALLVEMPTGQQLKLGSGFTDAQRAAPPAIGTQVSYRYRSLSAKGLPRHPVFLRERSEEPAAQP